MSSMEDVVGLVKVILVKEIAGKVDVVQAIVTMDTRNEIIESLQEDRSLTFSDVDGDVFWIDAKQIRHALLRPMEDVLREASEASQGKSGDETRK